MLTLCIQPSPHFQAIHHTTDGRTMAVQSDHDPQQSLLIHIEPPDRYGWISGTAQHYGPDKTQPKGQLCLPLNWPSNLPAFMNWATQQVATLIHNKEERNEATYWLKQHESKIRPHMKDPDTVWSD